MSSGLPADSAFSLKITFFRELDADYKHARDLHDQLIHSPGDPTLIGKLHNFFHKIAGTAHAVELGALAYLCSVCEHMAEMTQEGLLDAPERLVQVFAEGLAGVASVLDQHGVSGNERPLRAGSIETAGLTQPDMASDERVLSKIIVIDDDPFSARLIDSCLRGAGFASSFCCQAETALQVIQQELPDLIIMDVVMPGVDGFDLCRRVRAHPALQFTPIIFVTRKGDVEQRVRGLEVGGNDYISKPFEPQELVARVRSHLQRLATLRDMAIRDGLTRCFNHKYFKMRIDQELQRARRYKSELAVAMIDLDHFKMVNDTWGHTAGDAVLAHISDILAASVRTTDVVARYGGEEFGILLIQAGQSEALIISNRIRERIAGYNFLVPVAEGQPEQRIPITVSVGVAQLEPGDTLQSLLSRADAALYEAKNGGRNQVRVAARAG